MIILRSNFSVLTGLTVQDGYNWDRGLPVTFKELRTNTLILSSSKTKNNSLTGTAPYTKVRYRILSDVIPKYRLQTWFTFNANDYYSETKNLTSFNPREPIHPNEDRYGLIWSWNGLAINAKDIRSTLTTYISTAYDAVKIYDSLDDSQDIFEYPSSSVFLLSAVPPKGALNLRRSLSSTILQYNSTNDSMLYNTTSGTVLYERWSNRYNTSPNLLATRETLSSTNNPSILPYFNRNLYLSAGVEMTNRQPEAVRVLSSCFITHKRLKFPLTYTDEIGKSLSIAQASWNVPREEFDSTTYLVRNNQPPLLATQTPLNPVSILPVQQLEANRFLPTPSWQYLNLLKDTNRIGPYSETIGESSPQSWQLDGVAATNYAGFAPNATACLSAREAVRLEMRQSEENIFYSMSQVVGQTITAGQNIIAGIFVKPTGDCTVVRLNLGGPCFDTTPCYADWDLEAGILLNKAGVVNNYTIQSVGDGWFYISMQAQAPYTGACRYSFLLLDKQKYTLSVPLSTTFVLYRPPFYNNTEILVWEPQFMVNNGSLPGTLIPVQDSADDHWRKVHRISWFFVPNETSYHYFWLGSDTEAVLIYGEANKEEDIQNYPYDYLLCRNFPANNDQVYPEWKTHWDRSTLQGKSVYLLKNQVYYFEARWWQSNQQSYIDVGWSSTNPTWSKVQWFETSRYSEYEKRWLREGYTADAELEHVYSVPQTYTPSLSVRVDANLAGDYVYDDTDAEYDALVIEEVSPTANFAVLSTDYGFSPLEIEFSPRATKPGSYPIERIDWDFGDGTPIFSVTRHTTLTSNPDILYKPIDGMTVDIADPRNFNVRHTYNRFTVTEPRVFYPSITAYSAVTNSYNSCSREIGPVALRGKAKKEIVKTDFYGVQNNGTFIVDLQGQAAVLRKDNKYTKDKNNIQPTVLPETSNRIVYYNDLGTTVATNSGYGFKELLEI